MVWTANPLSLWTLTIIATFTCHLFYFGLKSINFDLKGASTKLITQKEMVTMNKVLGHMLKSLTKNHVEHIGGPELVCAFALNLLKSPSFTPPPASVGTCSLLWFLFFCYNKNLRKRTCLNHVIALSLLCFLFPYKFLMNFLIVKPGPHYIFKKVF